MFQDLINKFSEPMFIAQAVTQILLFTVAFYFIFRLLITVKAKKLIWLFVIFFFVGAIAVPLDYFIIVPLVFIVGILIIYSGEIRRSIRFGANKLESKNTHNKGNYDEEEVKNCISAIISALQNMSKKDIGAIIVLANNNVPQQILDSGVMINSDISSELIESVFFPKTPLHDGAMIINGTKIVATGCFLPLSQNTNIPKDLGTRHRAGIGITETLDVTALIVSEESGIISIIKGGKMTRYADTNMLKNTLSKFYWQELTRFDR